METRRSNVRWRDLKMTELELRRLTSHFAQSNGADGKSPKTVAWYSEMLSGFTRFLRSEGTEPIPADLDATAARGFVIHEQERGLSPYTVQAKVRALKAFSSWLFAESYTSANVLAHVRVPKAPVKLIEPLTPPEIDRLVGARNPLTSLGSRNLALLVTLLGTGLRVSEFCNLHFEDAHIKEGYLKVMGKGNKERVVPIGSTAQKMLWPYVFHFRPDPLGQNNDYLFLTLDGRQLQCNAVKLLLQRWGKKAGVPRLHAHLCRHTYATSFLNNKCGDVFKLQQILGHSTLEMVRRYVHYASDQDIMCARVSSPLDRAGTKRLRGPGAGRPDMKGRFE